MPKPGPPRPDDEPVPNDFPLPGMNSPTMASSHAPHVFNMPTFIPRDRALVIGLGGLQTAGKDAFADSLVAHHGFTKLGMSDVLHEALMTLDPLVFMAAGGIPKRYSDMIERHGYTDAKKIPEVRRLQRVMGTEIGRDLLGQDTWVNAIGRKIHALRMAGTSVALTGIRYPNELAMILMHGGTTVWVERPGIVQDTSHTSETSLSRDSFQIHVHNTGTLADLDATATSVLTAIRNRLAERL